MITATGVAVTHCAGALREQAQELPGGHDGGHGRQVEQVVVAGYQRGTPFAGHGHQVVVPGVCRRCGPCGNVGHETGAVHDEVEDLVPVARPDACGQVGSDGDAGNLGQQRAAGDGLERTGGEALQDLRRGA